MREVLDELAAVFADSTPLPPTTTQQGFACSQTPYVTSAAPYEVRGISSNNTDFYDIVFGPPTTNATSPSELQPTIDEMNRNLAFQNTIRTLSLSAAQAAGVPMSRTQGICDDVPVDTQSTLHDAKAMRVVPLCVGGAAPQPTPDPSPPPDQLPPVTVYLPPIGRKPAPVVDIGFPSLGGAPIVNSIFENNGGPLPLTPGASNSMNPDKPKISPDPIQAKKDCQDAADQRNRVNNAMCSAVGVGGLVTTALTGTTVGVVFFLLTKNGTIAVNVGAATTTGLGVLAAQLAVSCNTLASATYANESASCSASTQ